jgi:hypothetical protein
VIKERIVFAFYDEERHSLWPVLHASAAVKITFSVLLPLFLILSLLLLALLTCAALLSWSWIPFFPYSHGSPRVVYIIQTTQLTVPRWEGHGGGGHIIAMDLWVMRCRGTLGTRTECNMSSHRILLSLFSTTSNRLVLSYFQSTCSMLLSVTCNGRTRVLRTSLSLSALVQWACSRCWVVR